MGALQLLPNINNEEKLLAYLVDKEGTVSKMPFEINMANLKDFVKIFETNYLIFENQSGIVLFEISEGLLCYVNEAAGLTKGEVRKALYQGGIKCIR